MKPKGRSGTEQGRPEFRFPATVGVTVASDGRAWGSAVLQRGDGSASNVPARVAKGPSRKNKGEQKKKRKKIGEGSAWIVGREERECEMAG